MSSLLKLAGAHAALGRLLDNFRSLVLFATRFYVGWQFWKSGWLKVSSWSTTLDLFRTEYHVPLLPPQLAAVTGAGGELFFPALLFLTSLLGYFAGADNQLRTGLFRYLSAVLPGEASQLVAKTVNDVTVGSGGGKLSFGVLATLWAASNGMTAISESLNAPVAPEGSFANTSSPTRMLFSRATFSSAA